MKTNRDKTVEIELDEIDLKEMLLKSGDLSALEQYEREKQRRLFLDDEVDQYIATDLLWKIMQYNKEDVGIAPEDRRPIVLYIMSNGGCVNSGFEIIDIIQKSITPVYTVNMGYAYSMAFLIGLAGHKRYAMPNAKFLMHDGMNMIVNSGAKAQDQMEFQKRVEQRIKDYVLEQTLITESEYNERLRQEWYLFASEAKKFSMVDEIIGEDCTMEVVL